MLNEGFCHLVCGILKSRTVGFFYCKVLDFTVYHALCWYFDDKDCWMLIAELKLHRVKDFIVNCVVLLSHRLICRIAQLGIFLFG